MLASRLRKHMVDTAILERYKGENLSNERDWHDPVEIQCWVVDKADVIKQTQTELVVSKSTIWTLEEIGDKDRINGQDVLELYDGKSLVTHKREFTRVKI